MASKDTLFVCWLCCQPFNSPTVHFCHPECDKRTGIHRDFCKTCKSKALSDWEFSINEGGRP
jgi:hypothetical protein